MAIAKKKKKLILNEQNYCQTFFTQLLTLIIVYLYLLFKVITLINY